MFAESFLLKLKNTLLNMNNKKVAVGTVLLIATIFFISAVILPEKDPLHKRTFSIGITEVKDGVAAKKSIKDEITFKNGTLYSDYLKDKFGHKWLKYKINKDSIYMDEEIQAEIRMLEIEAVSTDEGGNSTIINFIVENWDIEGTIKMTKNDKPKKYFDFTGFEKGGKPKKERKPKDGQKPIVDTLKKE